MPTMSPTQRTLQRLRGESYLPTVVEKFNPHSLTRHDLWGFADILAIPLENSPEQVILAIQCTSASNLSSRVKKCLTGQPRRNIRILLGLGVRVEVWAWGKYRKNKQPEWRLKITRITLQDVVEEPDDE